MLRRLAVAGVLQAAEALVTPETKVVARAVVARAAAAARSRKRPESGAHAPHVSVDRSVFYGVRALDLAVHSSREHQRDHLIIGH